MGNIIAIICIVVILGGAIIYIVRAKKNGVHCIGCPTGSTCSGNCGSEHTTCSCCGHSDKETNE